MTSSKPVTQTSATISSSCSTPIAEKIGAAWATPTGVALCASMHMEQDADWSWFGWLCNGSAAAVHNISDRQTHAAQRITERIVSCKEKIYELTTVFGFSAIASKLLRLHLAPAAPTPTLL